MHREALVFVVNVVGGAVVAGCDTVVVSGLGEVQLVEGCKVDAAGALLWLIDALL